MITVTGCRTKEGWRMHNPSFPDKNTIYGSTMYIGYTFTEMKQKYRQNNHLEGKQIRWIII